MSVSVSEDHSSCRLRDDNIYCKSVRMNQILYSTSVVLAFDSN